MSEATTGAIWREGPLPYYVQLAEVLRNEIANGNWKPGDPLPSEADLCAFFAVSRPVVRQALGELVRQGIVHKERGRGTFVSHRTAPMVVQEIQGFSDDVTRRGDRIDTTVFRQETDVVPPPFAPLLGVRTGSDVIRLDRLRRVGDLPVVMTTTYLPPRFAGVLEADLRQRSLYAFLEEAYGITPSGGTRRLEAVPAEEAHALHLGVDVGAALLQITANNRDQHGQPFECFLAWYRGDRTSFEVEVAAGEAAPERLLTPAPRSSPRTSRSRRTPP